MKMFKNEVKENESAILAKQIAEFKAKGGVVKVVKPKKVKISQRTGDAYIGGIARHFVGQNDVNRKGNVALA